MFAGLGGADGVFSVHGVGQRDVDGVNVFVVAEGVHIFVVVDVGPGDLVLAGDGFRLVFVAADEGDYF